MALPSFATYVSEALIQRESPSKSVVLAEAAANSWLRSTADADEQVAALAKALGSSSVEQVQESLRAALQSYVSEHWSQLEALGWCNLEAGQDRLSEGSSRKLSRAIHRVQEDLIADSFRVQARAACQPLPSTCLCGAKRLPHAQARFRALLLTAQQLQKPLANTGAEPEPSAATATLRRRHRYLECLPAPLRKCLGGLAPQVALAPARGPRIVLLTGGMGAGKSTAIRALLNLERFVVIEADQFKEVSPLFNLMNHRLSSPELKKELHALSTRSAEALLLQAVKQQADIVFDSTLSWLPFALQTLEFIRDWEHHHEYTQGAGFDEMQEEYWARPPQLAHSPSRSQAAAAGWGRASVEPASSSSAAAPAPEPAATASAGAGEATAAAGGLASPAPASGRSSRGAREDSVVAALPPLPRLPKTASSLSRPFLPSPRESAFLRESSTAEHERASFSRSSRREPSHRHDSDDAGEPSRSASMPASPRLLAAPLAEAGPGMVSEGRGRRLSIVRAVPPPTTPARAGSRAPLPSRTAAHARAPADGGGAPDGASARRAAALDLAASLGNRGSTRRELLAAEPAGRKASLSDGGAPLSPSFMLRLLDHADSAARLAHNFEDFRAPDPWAPDPWAPAAAPRTAQGEEQAGQPAGGREAAPAATETEAGIEMEAEAAAEAAAAADEQAGAPAEPEEQLPTPRPYEVVMLGVMVNVPTAVERGFRRHVITGRSVPLRPQLRSHRLFARNFSALLPLVDQAILVESLEGNDLRVVVQKGGPAEGLQVHDPDAWTRLQRQAYWMNEDATDPSGLFYDEQ